MDNKTLYRNDRSINRVFTCEISKRYPRFEATPVDERTAREIRSNLYVRQIVDGVERITLNMEKYMLALVCACVISPKLTDIELQKGWCAYNPRDLLGYMLLPGEYEKLCLFVASICGYDDTRYNDNKPIINPDMINIDLTHSVTCRISKKEG